MCAPRRRWRPANPNPNPNPNPSLSPNPQPTSPNPHPNPNLNPNPNQVAAGEALTITYGAKPNAELLAAYGFALR